MLILILFSSSVAFARDFMSNKVKASNVKVVARIRPINKMESVRYYLQSSSKSKKYF